MEGVLGVGPGMRAWSELGSSFHFYRSIKEYGAPCYAVNPPVPNVACNICMRGLRDLVNDIAETPKHDPFSDGTCQKIRSWATICLVLTIDERAWFHGKR